MLHLLQYNHQLLTSPLKIEIFSVTSIITSKLTLKMPTYFIKDKTNTEIQVNRSFFNAYAKMSKQLSKAERKYEVLKERHETALKYDKEKKSRKTRTLAGQLAEAEASKNILDKDSSRLNKQLDNYAQRQKERPVRHRAEMVYGKPVNGKLPQRPDYKNANIIRGVAIGIGIASAITLAVFTAGLALIPLVMGVSFASQAGFLAYEISQEDKNRQKLEKEVKKEDKKIARKQAKQRAKQQKAGKQKDAFKGLTIVINKDKKTEKTKERAKVKSQKPKKKISSARTI